MVGTARPGTARSQFIGRFNPALQSKEAQLERGIKQQEATNPPSLQGNIIGPEPALGSATPGIFLPAAAQQEGYSVQDNTIYYKNPNSPNSAAVAVAKLASNGQLVALANTISQPIFANVSGVNQQVGTISYLPSVSNGQLSFGFAGFKSANVIIAQNGYIFSGIPTSYNQTTGQISFGTPNFQSGVSTALLPSNSALRAYTDFATGTTITPGTVPSGFGLTTTGQPTSGAFSTGNGQTTIIPAYSFSANGKPYQVNFNLLTGQYSTNAPSVLNQSSILNGATVQSYQYLNFNNTTGNLSYGNPLYFATLPGGQQVSGTGLFKTYKYQGEQFLLSASSSSVSSSPLNQPLVNLPTYQAAAPVSKGPVFSVLPAGTSRITTPLVARAQQPQYQQAPGLNLTKLIPLQIGLFGQANASTINKTNQTGSYLNVTSPTQQLTEQISYNINTQLGLQNATQTLLGKQQPSLFQHIPGVLETEVIGKYFFQTTISPAVAQGIVAGQTATTPSGKASAIASYAGTTFYSLTPPVQAYNVYQSIRAGQEKQLAQSLVGSLPLIAIGGFAGEKLTTATVETKVTSVGNPEFVVKPELSSSKTLLVTLGADKELNPDLLVGKPGQYAAGQIPKLAGISAKEGVEGTAEFSGIQTFSTQAKLFGKLAISKPVEYKVIYEGRFNTVTGEEGTTILGGYSTAKVFKAITLPKGQRLYTISDYFKNAQQGSIRITYDLVSESRQALGTKLVQEEPKGNPNVLVSTDRLLYPNQQAIGISPVATAEGEKYTYIPGVEGGETYTGIKYSVEGLKKATKPSGKLLLNENQLKALNEAELKYNIAISPKSETGLDIIGSKGLTIAEREQAGKTLFKEQQGIIGTKNYGFNTKYNLGARGITYFYKVSGKVIKIELSKEFFNEKYINEEDYKTFGETGRHELFHAKFQHEYPIIKGVVNGKKFGIIAGGIARGIEGTGTLLGKLYKAGVPVDKLPESITNIINARFIDQNLKFTEAPIHKLTELSYTSKENLYLTKEEDIVPESQLKVKPQEGGYKIKEQPFQIQQIPESEPLPTARDYLYGKEKLLPIRQSVKPLKPFPNLQSTKEVKTLETLKPEQTGVGSNQAAIIEPAKTIQSQKTILAVPSKILDEQDISKTIAINRQPLAKAGTLNTAIGSTALTKVKMSSQINLQKLVPAQKTTTKLIPLNKIGLSNVSKATVKINTTNLTKTISIPTTKQVEKTTPTIKSTITSKTTTTEKTTTKITQKTINAPFGGIPTYTFVPPLFNPIRVGIYPGVRRPQRRKVIARTFAGEYQVGYRPDFAHLSLGIKAPKTSYNVNLAKTGVSRPIFAQTRKRGKKR